MSIKIISFIDSYKHYEAAIKEFEKRLGKQVEIVKLKPQKNGDVMQKETDILKDILEKEIWYKIVLNPIGKNLSTEKFYDLMEEKQQHYKNIIFVIWWAEWIHYNQIQWLINFEMNLWKMVVPHILALLILMEQIYRITMIKKGSKYHK